MHSLTSTRYSLLCHVLQAFSQNHLGLNCPVTDQSKLCTPCLAIAQLKNTNFRKEIPRNLRFSRHYFQNFIANRETRVPPFSAKFILTSLSIFYDLLPLIACRVDSYRQSCKFLGDMCRHCRLVPQ